MLVSYRIRKAFVEGKVFQCHQLSHFSLFPAVFPEMSVNPLYPLWGILGSVNCQLLFIEHLVRP